LLFKQFEELLEVLQPLILLFDVLALIVVVETLAAELDLAQELVSDFFRHMLWVGDLGEILSERLL
jgi:hypothetical protein